MVAIVKTSDLYIFFILFSLFFRLYVE